MYVVQRLKKSDGRLVDAIYESLKSAYDPDISRFFVHQDAGYKKFFDSILDHPSYATYYSYDSISEELNGFACFQILGESVFLKHIVVDNRLRGSKIGTKLLHFSLGDIRKETRKRLNLLQLHVFEKNSKALSWYLSIGMQIVGCSYWYDLYPTLEPFFSNVNNITPISKFSKDNFGFVQVNYNGLFVGTLLAKKALIVKNLELLDQLDIIASIVRQNNIESVGFISDIDRESFELVDKSLLMSVKISDLEFIV